MASITEQHIRARVTIGSTLTVETPYVVSFSVRKARGQMCGTFNASLKVPVIQMSDILNSVVTIYAGVGSASNIIFTGYTYKSVINPIRTDSSLVMLNISGKDTLCKLEGQKINRRVNTYRDGNNPPERWGAITGIIRRDIPIEEKFEKKVYTHNPLFVDRTIDPQVITTPPVQFDDIGKRDKFNVFDERISFLVTSYEDNDTI